MKTMTCLLITLLGALCQAQTTLTERIDLSRGNRPSYTTGLVFPNGLEVWGFGIHQRETTDLEIGYTFYSKGNWSFAGYGVWWPDANQTFIIPWVTYSSPAASGQLTLNLAAYIPVRHGPHIVFSDNSRWVWKLNQKGLTGGLALQYGGEWLQLGAHVELETGSTTWRVRILPAQKDVPGSLRLEIIRRL